MTGSTYGRYGFLALLLALMLCGCAGVQTFPNAVRAGDTVAVAAGWKQDFSRQDITVVVTDANGAETVYTPGDPAIRAVVNLYPDPLSSLVVADRTGIEFSSAARTYAYAINSTFTGHDRDWWQTVVFVDLPANLPQGSAGVAVTNTAGASAWSAFEVVPGEGKPAVFEAELHGPIWPSQMRVLERVPHYQVDFTGDVLPHALELLLTHDPDVDHGGSGRPYVVNPRGEIKNLAWSGDGSSLRVLLLPTGENTVARLKDYKFYVTGGITGLQLAELAAFDADGNRLVGVSASLRAGR
jgi:hypothetical protein